MDAKTDRRGSQSAAAIFCLWKLRLAVKRLWPVS
jgi:hypothetical protein